MYANASRSLSKANTPTIQVSPITTTRDMEDLSHCLQKRQVILLILFLLKYAKATFADKLLLYHLELTSEPLCDFQKKPLPFVCT